MRTIETNPFLTARCYYSFHLKMRNSDSEIREHEQDFTGGNDSILHWSHPELSTITVFCLVCKGNNAWVCPVLFCGLSCVAGDIVFEGHEINYVKT